MKERLIELVSSAPLGFGKFEIYYHKKDAKKIAEYLLANGVIVPPCKVGDTVYEINTKYPKVPFINRFIVTAFHITSGENILGRKKTSHMVVGVDYMPSLTKRIYLENFGKTVFLTKEEAEKALAERSEGK